MTPFWLVIFAIILESVFALIGQVWAAIGWPLVFIALFMMGIQDSGLYDFMGTRVDPNCTTEQCNKDRVRLDINRVRNIILDASCNTAACDFGIIEKNCSTSSCVRDLAVATCRYYLNDSGQMRCYNTVNQIVISSIPGSGRAYSHMFTSH